MAEVALQGEAVLLDALAVEERDGGDLEDVRRAAVEEAAALSEGADKRLGTDDPTDAPAGQAPALCQPVNQDDLFLKSEPEPALGLVRA